LFPCFDIGTAANGVLKMRGINDICHKRACRYYDYNNSVILLLRDLLYMKSGYR
jgi:hypothetical protein